MANIMEEVAKLLGLELEEEFDIEGFPSKFKFTEIGLLYWSNTDRRWCSTSGIPNKLLTGEYNLIKLPKPILDDSEKEYLGNIIKPFRDRVVSIEKVEDDDPEEEYLIVYIEHFKDKSIWEPSMLPNFEKETMYKGMELGKRYTLEELGL